MLLRALMAALHFLALGIGLGAVFVRGLRLRDLRRRPADPGPLPELFGADALWGLSAALWIVTGLLRAFAGLEKATAFYVRNGFFYVKLSLFATVFALEIVPMLTFIAWRRARGRRRALDHGADRAAGAAERRGARPRGADPVRRRADGARRVALLIRLAGARAFNRGACPAGR